MIYKQFQDLKLSALGMGAMRLPVLDGDNSKIDEAAVAEMVAYAMEQGINYYDTAYMYHDGQSEIVMGKVLNKYPRENYYIATKFPGYDKTNMEHVAEILRNSLKKQAWSILISICSTMSMKPILMPIWIRSMAFMNI